MIWRVFHVAAACLWNSLPAHFTSPPISPSSTVVLNHIISSHFAMLSDSSLICTVPVPTVDRRVRRTSRDVDEAERSRRLWLQVLSNNYPASFKQI